MQAYTYPIHTAWMFFPVAAFLMTIPYMLFNYRRYGSVSLLRSAILFSFLFYMMCAFFLVILPLPDRASVAEKTGPIAQLIPFNFVVQFIERTKLNLRDVSTYLPAMKQSVFYQPLFNIALTVPFGVYISYYFKQDAKKTILFTFLLSLFFEITQLTGLYGLYSRPYRLFDVDDLMTNTLGGYLGHVIGVRLVKILPSRSQIDQASLAHGQHVSYTRRFFALCIDGVILIVAASVLSFLTNMEWAALEALIYFGYFVGLQVIWHGKTLGKAVVRIRVINLAEGRPFWMSLLVKYALPYGLWLLMKLGVNLAVIADSVVWIVLLLAGMMVGLLLLIDLAMSFRRGKRTWYEVISKTRNVSAIPVPKDNI